MTRPIKVLLQTTIPPMKDDWSIVRFGALSALLRGERDASANPIFAVTTRDRDPVGAPDGVLSKVDSSDFDELWLFAVDVGDGLTKEDCEAISRFHASGRGLLVTRDHMDLGCSICTLSGVGKAHHFHTHNVDPTAAARGVDDPYSRKISWPNYHSGANGDFQEIAVVEPVHPLMSDPASPTGAIRYLPSHPHEGAVAAPPDEPARVIATGISKVTGQRFNIAVAFEASAQAGRAVAQSTFHHFADYNWNPRSGSPSFVDEPPGDAILRLPQALEDTHRYVRNVAYWLANRSPGESP
jgi:hypothetical protein